MHTSTLPTKHTSSFLTTLLLIGISLFSSGTLNASLLQCGSHNANKTSSTPRWTALYSGEENTVYFRNEETNRLTYITLDDNTCDDNHNLCLSTNIEWDKTRTVCRLSKWFNVAPPEIAKLFPLIVQETSLIDYIFVQEAGIWFYLKLPPVVIKPIKMQPPLLRLKHFYGRYTRRHLLHKKAYPDNTHGAICRGRSLFTYSIHPTLILDHFLRKAQCLYLGNDPYHLIHHYLSPSLPYQRAVLIPSPLDGKQDSLEALRASSFRNQRERLSSIDLDEKLNLFLPQCFLHKVKDFSHGVTYRRIRKKDLEEDTTKVILYDLPTRRKITLTGSTNFKFPSAYDSKTVSELLESDNSFTSLKRNNGQLTFRREDFIIRLNRQAREEMGGIYTIYSHNKEYKVVVNEEDCYICIVRTKTEKKRGRRLLYIEYNPENFHYLAFIRGENSKDKEPQARLLFFQGGAVCLDLKKDTVKLKYGKLKYDTYKESYFNIYESEYESDDEDEFNDEDESDDKDKSNDEDVSKK